MYLSLSCGFLCLSEGHLQQHPLLLLLLLLGRLVEMEAQQGDGEELGISLDIN